MPRFSGVKASPAYRRVDRARRFPARLFGVTPMRKWTSLTTAAAVILTSVGLSATPAEARGRHHGGGWGPRHHDGIHAGGRKALGSGKGVAGRDGHVCRLSNKKKKK